MLGIIEWLPMDLGKHRKSREPFVLHVDLHSLPSVLHMNRVGVLVTIVEISFVKCAHFARILLVMKIYLIDFFFSPKIANTTKLVLLQKC